MAAIVAHSAANPEFARIVVAARLRGTEEFAFDLAPEGDEADAIARLMGAQALRKLRFSGRLAPAPRGAWRLDGTLGATVIQTCVVTLEPVTTRIDIPVRRVFTPDFQPSVEIDADGPEDETEPLEDRIDLGLVALEALALALPAYPRREGAALPADAAAPEGAAPAQDGVAKPFAALAALRAKMDDGS